MRGLWLRVRKNERRLWLRVQNERRLVFRVRRRLDVNPT